MSHIITAFPKSVVSTSGNVTDSSNILTNAFTYATLTTNNSASSITVNFDIPNKHHIKYVNNIKAYVYGYTSIQAIASYSTSLNGTVIDILNGSALMPIKAGISLSKDVDLDNIEVTLKMDVTGFDGNYYDYISCIWLEIDCEFKPNVKKLTIYPTSLSDSSDGTGTCANIEEALKKNSSYANLRTTDSKSTARLKVDFDLSSLENLRIISAHVKAKGHRSTNSDVSRDYACTLAGSPVLAFTSQSNDNTVIVKLDVTKEISNQIDYTLRSGLSGGGRLYIDCIWLEVEYAEVTRVFPNKIYTTSGVYDKTNILAIDNNNAYFYYNTSGAKYIGVQFDDKNYNLYNVVAYVRTFTTNDTTTATYAEVNNIQITIPYSNFNDSIFSEIAVPLLSVVGNTVRLDVTQFPAGRIYIDCIWLEIYLKETKRITLRPTSIVSANPSADIQNKNYIFKDGQTVFFDTSNSYKTPMTFTTAFKYKPLNNLDIISLTGSLYGRRSDSAASVSTLNGVTIPNFPTSSYGISSVSLLDNFDGNLTYSVTRNGTNSVNVYLDYEEINIDCFYAYNGEVNNGNDEFLGFLKWVIKRDLSKRTSTVHLEYYIQNIPGNTRGENLLATLSVDDNESYNYFTYDFGNNNKVLAISKDIVVNHDSEGKADPLTISANIMYENDDINVDYPIEAMIFLDDMYKTSGTFSEATPSYNVTLSIDWAVAQSIENNESTVTLLFYYYRSSGSYSYTNTIEYVLGCGDETYSVKIPSVSLNAGKKTLLLSHSFTIKHDEFGSHNEIPIGAYISPLSFNAVSGTISFNDIPRMSTFLDTYSRFEIGDKLAFTRTSVIDVFRPDFKIYVNDTLIKTITDVPLEWEYDCISDGTVTDIFSALNGSLSGIAKFELTTYERDSGNQIGTTQFFEAEAYSTMGLLELNTYSVSIGSLINGGIIGKNQNLMYIVNFEDASKNTLLSEQVGKKVFNAYATELVEGNRASYTINSNDSITINGDEGTETWWGRVPCIIKGLAPSTQYTFSVDVDNPNGLNCGLYSSETYSNGYYCLEINEMSTETAFSKTVTIETSPLGVAYIEFYLNYTENDVYGNVTYNNITLTNSGNTESETESTFTIDTSKVAQTLKEACIMNKVATYISVEAYSVGGKAGLIRSDKVVCSLDDKDDPLYIHDVITFRDGNTSAGDLIGDSRTYIKGMSNLIITIPANVVKGASKFTVVCDTFSEEYTPLETDQEIIIGTLTTLPYVDLIVSLYDASDNVIELNDRFNVLEYFDPTLTPLVKRVASTNKVLITSYGTFSPLPVNGYPAQTSAELSFRWRKKIGEDDYNEWNDIALINTNNDVWTVLSQDGTVLMDVADINQQATFDFEFSDALVTLRASITIGVGTPIMFMDMQHNSIGFNTMTDGNNTNTFLSRGNFKFETGGLYFNDAYNYTRDGINFIHSDKQPMDYGNIQKSDYDTFYIKDGVAYLNDREVFNSNGTSSGESTSLYYNASGQVMSAGTIQPSKTLSECAHGWCIVFGSSLTNVTTITIPKAQIFTSKTGTSSYVNYNTTVGYYNATDEYIRIGISNTHIIGVSFKNSSSFKIYEVTEI